jgi:hypothetical protein
LRDDAHEFCSALLQWCTTEYDSTVVSARLRGLLARAALLAIHLTVTRNGFTLSLVYCTVGKPACAAQAHSPAPGTLERSTISSTPTAAPARCAMWLTPLVPTIAPDPRSRDWLTNSCCTWVNTNCPRMPACKASQERCDGANSEQSHMHAGSLLRYKAFAVMLHLHDLLQTEPRTQLQQHTDRIPVDRLQLSWYAGC